MEGNLLEVELDAHVDSADDVLQLRYDVRGGLLESRGGGGGGGDRSIDWSSSSQACRAWSLGVPAGAAQHALGGPVVGGAQHVVRSLACAQQGARGLAGCLRGEPSEAVHVGLLPVGLLSLLGGGSDQLVLLHGMVGDPDTRDVEIR